MTSNEQARFRRQYNLHVRALKLRGLSQKTIEAYSRAVRRIANHHDCCPDRLSVDQLEEYFADLVESHSWSTVKVDRNGLQFFWKHVLKKDWSWLQIIKAPKIKSLPDVLTVSETSTLISTTRKLRYRVFFLAVYSMGLRLGEALSLQVSDVDSQRMITHIRRGKGCKDRFVPLPVLACDAMRAFWRTHKNPSMLFPNQIGSEFRIQTTLKHMDRGGAQSAMKAAVADCGIKKKFQFTLSGTASPLIFLNRV